MNSYRTYDSESMLTPEQHQALVSLLDSVLNQADEKHAGWFAKDGHLKTSAEMTLVRTIHESIPLETRPGGRCRKGPEKHARTRFLTAARRFIQSCTDVRRSPAHNSLPHSNGKAHSIDAMLLESKESASLSTKQELLFLAAAQLFVEESSIASICVSATLSTEQFETLRENVRIRKNATRQIACAEKTLADAGLYQPAEEPRSVPESVLAFEKKVEILKAALVLLAPHNETRDFSQLLDNSMITKTGLVVFYEVSKVKQAERRAVLQLLAQHQLLIPECTALLAS